jgi:hypothetical protein
MKALTIASCLVVLVLAAGSSISLSGATDKKDVDEGVPEVVTAGFNAYKAGGADAAVQTWFAGSALAGPQGIAAYAQTLKQAEAYYGPYKSYEVIWLVDVSASTKIAYAVVNYEKGPFFTKLMCYKNERGWIVVSSAYNMQPEAILPPSVLAEAK